MGQTLTNGIYLPDEGEVRCYAGLASNWTTLDAVVGGYRVHVANENIHITSAERSKWDNGVSQAYVLRYASVSLTALGTVAFSALDNTDNIKIGDKVLDSEGKLFALTAVDTANSTATLSALLIDLSKDSDLSNYYTKTETDTLLNDKADDSGVMHQSGDETVGGIKSFTGTRTEFKRSNNDGVVLFNNETFVKGDTPNDTTYLCRKYYGGATSIPTAIGYSSVTVSEQGDRTMIQFYCLANIAGSTTRTTLQLNYNKSLSGADAQYINITGNIFPGANNTYSLGNSSYKWKQLNGINPGALSFPDLSSGLDISSYLDTSQSSINYYTPPVDGWISIKGRAGVTIGIVIIQGDFAQMGYTVQDFGNTNRVSFCALPVKAGVQVEIWLKSVTTIDFAKFYPCQGNV